jgi:hypothetical protein
MHSNFPLPRFARRNMPTAALACAIGIVIGVNLTAHTASQAERAAITELLPQAFAVRPVAPTSLPVLIDHARECDPLGGIDEHCIFN